MISGYIEGFLQREHTGPEHVEELITTLKKMCGEEAHSTQILREAIETLTNAAESRELNSAGHGEMVARYSEIIARSLGLPPEDVGDLVFAARVHDVGKLFVPGTDPEQARPADRERVLSVEDARRSWRGNHGHSARSARNCGRRCSTITNPSMAAAILTGLRGEKIPLVGAHHGHRRRIREHDQRAFVRGCEDQRTGLARTGKVERNPL